jgi:hypothetical protein
MQDSLVALAFTVAVLAGIVAIVTLVASRGAYREIGGGGPHSPSDGEPPGGAAGDGRDEEIRQMLGARSARSARSARRERRGEQPPDVDAELAELLRPAADERLRDDVRALVDARNRRRARTGLAPLDVDAEIERRLRGPN